jgi:Ca2+-binding EF-hand superfamily protein
MSEENSNEPNQTLRMILSGFMKNIKYDDLPDIDIRPDEPWFTHEDNFKTETIPSQSYSIERLRDIFNRIDRKRKGKILVEELYASLKENLYMVRFGFETVKIFLNIYDKDLNDRVNFEEFVDIFTSLNQRYEEFIKYDKDGNGLIDSDELGNLFKEKELEFTSMFFGFVENESFNLTGNKHMGFDRFVRFMTKFELLRAEFEHERLTQRNNLSLEGYICSQMSYSIRF